MTLCLPPARSAKGEEQKIFGWSMVAMGTAATLYHATSGRLRSLLRKVDYYTISLSCMAMERSLHPKSVGLVGRATRVASLAALPFKPTAVTACYAAQMEVRHAFIAFMRFAIHMKLSCLEKAHEAVLLPHYNIVLRL